MLDANKDPVSTLSSPFSFPGCCMRPAKIHSSWFLGAWGLSLRQSIYQDEVDERIVLQSRYARLLDEQTLDLHSTDQ